MASPSLDGPVTMCSHMLSQHNHLPEVLRPSGSLGTLRTLLLNHSLVLRAELGRDQTPFHTRSLRVHSDLPSRASTTPCFWWRRHCPPSAAVWEARSRPFPSAEQGETQLRQYGSSPPAAARVQSLCCSRRQGQSAPRLASRRCTSQTRGLCMSLDSYRKAESLPVGVALLGSPCCGRHELQWLARCCHALWGVSSVTCVSWLLPGQARSPDMQLQILRNRIALKREGSWWTIKVIWILTCVTVVFGHLFQKIFWGVGGVERRKDPFHFNK